MSDEHQGRQFPRKAKLYLRNDQNALDVSELRFTFKIQNSLDSVPNTAMIRVYNLDWSTVENIRSDFTSVTLEAGYEDGNYGIIFQGDVKQYKAGRESSVDSYLDIYAADGDQIYNFAVINTVVAAGSSAYQRVIHIAEQAGVPVDEDAVVRVVGSTTGGILPRGKTMWGMARAHLNDVACTYNAQWSIQQGKLTMVSLAGYVPGNPVVLNSSSGLIGVPEATDNGIEVVCLLNALIKLGTRVQIDNRAITSTYITKSGLSGFPGPNDKPFFAIKTYDGVYKVLVAEHEGDTRGTPWYTTITCLAMADANAPPEGKAVNPFG